MPPASSLLFPVSVLLLAAALGTFFYFLPTRGLRLGLRAGVIAILIGGWFAYLPYLATWALCCTITTFINFMWFECGNCWQLYGRVVLLVVPLYAGFAGLLALMHARDRVAWWQARLPLWILVTTLGWGAATAVLRTFSPGDEIGDRVLRTYPLALLIGGSLTALGQWALLRRWLAGRPNLRIGPNTWLAVSALVWASAWGPLWIAFLSLPSLTGFLLGASVGLVQWFVLEKWVKGAGWWIVTSGLAMGQMFWVIQDWIWFGNPLDRWSTTLLLPLLYSLPTGMLMISLLALRPRETLAPA